MGDRVYCGFTICKEDWEKILLEYNGDKQKFIDDFCAEEIDESDCRKWVYIRDYQCNYGNWDELVSFLGRRKIEYDKEWEGVFPQSW